MSNREIADALFVTVRTTEFHLNGAFKKLGIRSRHQLSHELLGTHEARRVDRVAGPSRKPPGTVSLP